MTATPNKIALFGGSFDPVHKGHTRLLETALTELDLDLAYMIPCKQSPHKANAPQASDQHRLEMCQLSIAHLSKVKVSSYELDSTESSYAWKTVAHFQELYPNTTLYWILGTDQWTVIDTWAEPEFLRDNLHFIVLERQSEIKSRPNYRYTPLKFDDLSSSTAVRNHLKRHDDSDLLEPIINNYISKNKLYKAKF